MIRPPTNGARLLLSAVLLSQNAHSWAQAHRVRVIPYQYTTPIKEELRPDDDVVKIAREDVLVSSSDIPSAEAFIAYLVSESDVVAVVKVDDVAGVFVDGGTWIHTQVTSTVKEVLKDQNRPLRVGSGLRFEFSGGQAAIGHVLVTTSDDQPTVTAGQPYLVFAEVNPDDRRLYPRHVPLLINGDMLINKLPFATGAGDKKDPLDGYSLKTLASQVRRLVKVTK